MKIKRALVSVSDKTGLEGFTRGLAKLGIEILSTGGTAKSIRSFGIPVMDVSSRTHFPEMLDGRVKTLHPVIHAALLALRDNPEHMRQIKEEGISPIDMVVVNLYPFEETMAKKDASEEEIVENIDIGGPSMLRSAAKNFRFVAAVSSPAQYDKVLEELKTNGGQLKESTLRELAGEVFARTSGYDGTIAKYLESTENGAQPPEASLAEGGRTEEKLPERINTSLQKIRDLRYGENPHQRGALYKDISGKASGIVGAEQIQGKELSFNNMMDLNAAFYIVRSFKKSAACIVKHNNPCGVAEAKTLEAAYLDALDSDRLSAFGGIIGFNKPINGSMAKLILKEADFIECILAPAYEQKALKVFEEKKNLRVLRVPFPKGIDSEEKDMKKIFGGMLIQDMDVKELKAEDLKIVTRKKPSDKLIESLIFAWKIVKYVKSNAIVLCQGTKTVGIGAGQASRVDSAITAIRKAGPKAKGSVMASDAFFPKPDSIIKAHKAGIRAIIQPGGSIRDKEIIAACDKFAIPMVFTGIRHFRH